MLPYRQIHIYLMAAVKRYALKLCNSSHLRKFYITLLLFSIILFISYALKLKGSWTSNSKKTTTIKPQQQFLDLDTILNKSLGRSNFEEEGNNSFSETKQKPTTYIVDTKGCKIPDLDPWDPLIQEYIKKPPPTVCKGGKPTLIGTNLTKLFIVQEAVSTYVKEYQTLNCCYRAFWRHPHHLGQESEKVFASVCIPFVQTTIKDDYVVVTCYVNKTEIYRDYFAFIQEKPEIESRCASITSELKSSNLNALIFGIDGMSRNHLFRDMPRTAELLHNLSAVDMAGVNVVGPYTIYNLVPFLTGLSLKELKSKCFPKSSVPFDLCPWIFKNFSQAGYRTAYGEDLATYSFFCYTRGGFRVPPTDYYLNPALTLPYWAQKHMKRDCFGTRTETQILLSFMNDYLTTMKSKHFFGFFWDGRLTYHHFTVHPSFDMMYESFIKRHFDEGLLNKTILVFLSDHGFRWGEIRKTYQGLHEQRNTFLFFLFPDWFKEKYSLAIENIYNNTKKLITLFDAHETLLDIINHTRALKDEACLNRTLKLKGSAVLPRGISLFLPIPETRTCKDAEIAENLCLCQDLVPLPADNKTVSGIALVLMTDLCKLVSKYPQCSKWKLKEIKSAYLHKQSKSIMQSMGTPKKLNATVKGEVRDLMDYTIVVEATLGGAMFEATYRYRKGSGSIPSSFQLLGNIQRISYYGNQSICMDEYMLKPFCYCEQ